MKPALLLVDLQADYLATPGLQPPAEHLIVRVTALLHHWRDRHLPVLHLWTTLHPEQDRRLPHWRRADRWACVAGTPGHQTPDGLCPLAGEPILHKTGFNPFADGRLDRVLGELGCDTVVLAGLHLHACVRTTAVECLERGYAVHIVDDAVASNDAIHAAATRRWLAERCVVFEPERNVLARLEGRLPAALIHRSPRCTDSILFEVPIEGAPAIAAATHAAQHAGLDWRRTPIPTRLGLLEQVARRLDESASEFARQMAVDIGKPVAQGREEVHRAAANIRDVIRRAAVWTPRRREPGGVVRDQPQGVIALISAWNNPVAIPLGKIAPALAYGNTVVWKPAPAATRVARGVLRLLREAGVPADAVGLVTGDQTTAQQLAAAPLIRALTFTGSLRSGHAVQEICARRVVPLQAELSGNNAAIVWEEADPASAAAQVARGAFAFAGQRCTANRRVIAHTSHFERFFQELHEAADRLVWGDPLDEATEIGPVLDPARRDELEEWITGAQASGAAHRFLRSHETQAGQSWVQAGAFVRPALLGCDRPDHPLVQEEMMGPVLVVQRAEHFEQALALCNGVRHGLISALFSASPARQQQFLAEARAGVLKINTSTAGVDITLPFGGWNASGIGPPEHGEGDRLFYTRLQAVYGAEENAPGE